MAVLLRNVTERHRAEERQTLAGAGSGSPGQDALSVVLAVVLLTRAPDVRGYVTAVEGRVAVLARAQTLLAQDRWSGANLGALIAGELASVPGGRQAELDGPGLALPSGLAQSIAVALYELATNAVKHGARSVATGHLSVSWQVKGRRDEVPLLLRWVETGRHLINGAPEGWGFGSRLLDATMRDQLGGSATLAWERSGLVCEISVPIRSAEGDTGATDVVVPV
ncbi:HWE histidine kinase domain-containing protein [Roseomonas sp. KE2513]|uniref:HWE histidine kinase domain-containing protein n=1 Tax=Roseomonas sp. KE2513 TaxID=2479202 RepID=UPI0018DF9587|nr:HWE histidine kinase domain-containing protein [Roseomonas sp. KE2513]